MDEASTTIRMIAADVPDRGCMYYLIDSNYDFIPDAKEFLDWKVATNRASATMMKKRNLFHPCQKPSFAEKSHAMRNEMTRAEKVACHAE